MIRLDKYLTDMKAGTRSQVKEKIRKGLICVNGQVIKKPETKLDEKIDKVTLEGRIIGYDNSFYYMLNKPQGVISATEDGRQATVLECLGADARSDLFPVGRLDKDTEGLLLLTNDGALAHELLSPKKHVPKTYEVHLARTLTEEAAKQLAAGVDINEGALTAPAGVVFPACNKKDLIRLTVTEGKFHQVKRMLQAVGNEVLFLKRVSMGSLKLDESLAPGEYRRLTAEEITALKRCALLQKTLRRIRGVIFDLDGSLVDSMWIWKQIDIEYLGKFGIPLPEDLQQKIEGFSFSETACYFKERFAIPDPIQQIKDDWNRMAWEKYEKEVPLKPGVQTFLDWCQKRNIKLGIATSNSRELVENVAKVHGLRDTFHCIMTGCDVAKGKPAPDVYLAAAKAMNVEPADCLVFEDIVPGIQAGKAAGMTVCAVEDAYSLQQRAQKEALADFYINDFTDLEGYFL